MLIQLPNDVKSIGYRDNGDYSYTQMFHSASLNFTGTEEEFLYAGHAYGYIEIDKYTRRVIAEYKKGQP